MALATAEQKQVDQLKKLIGPTDYTDEQLWDIIVSVDGSTYAAAALIWSEKEATTATLFDIKEGSSSRDLGDIHDNAAAMARKYSALARDEAVGDTGRPRTRAIVRPSA